MDQTTTGSGRLETVVAFKGIQVTGITLSERGRMFVNFPRWRDGVPFSVAEVTADGMPNPYPDPQTNIWENGDRPEPDKFVCVQSVVTHGDYMYILDTKNPSMRQIIDVPTLYVCDLRSNRIVRKYPLEHSTKKHSYTNDLRIDRKHGKIYLTDSGAAGLIVLDMASGDSYRILDDHPITRAEFDSFHPGGTSYRGTIHSDGIALDERHDILYIHALTGYTLYGIPTVQLLERRIEPEHMFRMSTPATDGIILDRAGRLYMGDLENNAVVWLSPDRRRMHTLAQGGNISWPDTFAVYGDSLYFTNSRIHEAVGDIAQMVFPVDKIRLPR